MEQRRPTDEPSYTLIRTGRKSIALVVDAFGVLTVRAPYGAQKADIDALIGRHLPWIEKTRGRIAAANVRYLPFIFFEGATLPYLGRSLTLSYAECPDIRCEDDMLLLPPGTDQERLLRWLRVQAEYLLAERTAYYAGKMRVSFRSMKITGAKTRWGSCSAADRICFSWRLILCTPSAIDYVVVHELSHIIYKNHGSEFWAQVRSVLPDYAERRNWLKQNQRLMQII